MNYLNVTYEQLLQDFKARLNSDPKFKNIGSATIYGMFMEMIAAVTEMTNFYVQRTAEESFISTARLDSSVIKHAKGLGYNPRRPVPARCELRIRLRGPLPSSLKEGTEIFFTQDDTDLVYNGYKFILDSGYSYRFTREDIANGQSSDWSKELYFSVPQEKSIYMPLTGISYYSTKYTVPISCFQGERKTFEIIGTANIDKIGNTNQFYDIDDLEFSNWYSKRDPFAYKNGVYRRKNSWCQVGKGPNEIDAFQSENTYDIEDQSIYLNDAIVNTPPDEQIDKKFKVCLIDTNSDKTVRLSFASEPNIADIGLTTTEDNIYVKYLITKGKEVNRTGVKGSIMTHNNNINVSQEGNIINLTNNVQFIINTDIYGGEDFEPQESIKINAPAYFASCGKLVTKNDYASYFRALTSPITVQNALVYGQQELEGADKVRHDLVQNNIIYCIAGHLYRKNNGNWAPRNVLTEPDDNNDAFSIYGDKYLDHLCDYIKMLYSYEGFFNKIYKLGNDDEEQWLKNARLIYDNCKHKMEINSILYPLPPIVQYYDVVGTVEVDKTTDIESYTNEMKNKLYEYLDKKSPEDRNIYKSEIINLYNKNEHTKSVNIDIKISDIIYSEKMYLEWNAYNNAIFHIEQDKELQTYKDALNNYKTDIAINDAYGKGWWNKLTVSNVDVNGNPVNPLYFNGRTITLKIKYLNNDGTGKLDYDPTATNDIYTLDGLKFQCIVNEDDNTLSLCPETIISQGEIENNQATDCYRNYEGRDHWVAPATQEKDGSDDGVVSLSLGIPTSNDFYSTSDFNEYRMQDYKIDEEKYNKITELLIEWYEGLSTIKSLDRPIPLPYTVLTNNMVTRKEDVIRRGNFEGEPKVTLSEFAFWNYLVPEILKIAYPTGNLNGIYTKTDYDDEIWEAATKLIMDIYPLIKPGICDSILDSNNNIVNFSMDMDLPIVYNKIKVIPEMVRY